MRSMLRRTLALSGFMLAVFACTAPATERKDVPVQYTWDLTALFKDESAWNRSRADLEKRLPVIGRFKGHLGLSSDSLALALETQTNFSKDLSRLSTYASQSADEDARDSHHGELRDAARRLRVDFNTASAYMRPELLAIGVAKVRGFMAANPRLKDYRAYLEDILRYAAHTLSAEQEKVAAQADRMSNAGNTIRDQFSNAELPYPTIKLSTGESVRLDDAAYTQYRQSTNRADRDSVFRAFWLAHQQFQGTFAATLNAQLQAHVFDRDVHRFNSCVEDALFSDNIPPRVYTQLLDDVHANLPTLHRYLKLKQRMLKQSDLRYEDLYAPMVENVEPKYTPEQAMAIVLEAVAPLGKAYVDTLKHGFASRWIDWMPTTGKASGAYSTGTYGVHPYQLQNFTGLYDEVGTLAHESGHSMHTYLSSSHQPYPSHGYAIFVAEVASTLNENLLFHRMLDHTQDKKTRLWLLGAYLDNLRGTLFRQTMFAEFELRAHELAEKGEGISGESLSKLNLEITRKYYGHDLGVCKVDDLYGVEWTYIPHYFYNFYVYQYATSIVASTALANGIREEAALHNGTAKRDAYLLMLSSGSSKYPIDLLKGAGVDMTTSAPFRAAIKEMNSVMDEMDKLLK